MPCFALTRRQQGVDTSGKREDGVFLNNRGVIPGSAPHPYLASFLIRLCAVGLIADVEKMFPLKKLALNDGDVHQYLDKETTKNN